MGNLFTAGGVVMWPLLAFSMLAVALIIERILFWVKINNQQNRVVREVLQLYRSDNVVGALDKLQQNTDLPIARIFLAALELDHQPCTPVRTSRYCFRINCLLFLPQYW